MPRAWTTADDEHLLANYGRVPTREICRALRRSSSSVYQHAAALGLVTPRWQPLSDRRLVSLIRRRHAEGWMDGEIAAEWSRISPQLPLSRRTLRDLRDKLGLPSNAHNERHRDQVRQRTQRQLAEAGVDSVGQLRALAYRRWVEQRGWPGYLRVRHAQILDLLYDYGPQTREAIVDVLQMRRVTQRNWLSSKYGRGSYLADLMAAGFVVRSRWREVRGLKRGMSVHRYQIAGGIVRNDPATWPSKERWDEQVERQRQRDPGRAGPDSAAGRADLPSPAAGGSRGQRGRGRRGGDRGGDRGQGQAG